MKKYFNNIKTVPIFPQSIFQQSSFKINLVKNPIKSFKILIHNKEICRKNPITSDKLLEIPEKYSYIEQPSDHTILNNSAIFPLLTMLQLKSSETKEHSQRLCRLALLMSRQLGLDKQELNRLQTLCLLHDIGKITVPGHILSKPDKLTSQELLIMQKHVQYGYLICCFNPDLSHIAELILCHHERYDGLGYPRSLKGEAIPFLSRILSLIDAYDAMTNDRIYQKALNFEDAKKEILDSKGTQFDPALVDIFIKIIEGSG